MKRFARHCAREVATTLALLAVIGLAAYHFRTPVKAGAIVATK